MNRVLRMAFGVLWGFLPGLGLIVVGALQGWGGWVPCVAGLWLFGAALMGAVVGEG